MSRPVVVADTDDGAARGSVLAALRAQAAQVRAQATTDLPVGGAFGDRLVIRYGVLPIEDLDRYSDLAAGGAVSNVNLAIDMMVSTCRTVLYDGIDLNVKLDRHLWELLGYPLPTGMESSADLTPREIVSAVFGDNGMALGSHASTLITWMEGQRSGEAPTLG